MPADSVNSKAFRVAPRERLWYLLDVEPIRCREQDAPMPPKLFFVAGEASGDIHAARVIEALRNLRPGIEILAYGGPRMKEAGANLLLPLAERAVTGFVEVLGHLNFFRQALAQTAEMLDRQKPDAVVLVDFPGFNFRVARLAYQRGIPVIYYIAPQVWAWHASRIHEMKRWARKVLVIFPFEEDLFVRAGIDARFVGHPLIEALEGLPEPGEMLRSMGSMVTRRSCLVPGSRPTELQRMRAILLDAAGIVSRRMPEVRFFLPLAESLSRESLGTLPAQPEIQVIEHPTFAHRSMADFALTVSGTATLENALLGIPMAIVYKISWFSYLIARCLAKVKHIGMANILAGKTVCREFIQHEATPEALADYACEVLGSPERREAIRAQLRAVRDSLGGPGASLRAAQAILGVIEG